MRISHLYVAGLSLISAAALFSSTLTAVSQERSCPTCSEDAEQIIACIQKEFGQEVRTIALNHRGSLVRTFANDETGSWTIVTTMASGQGCVNAYGRHFEIILPVVRGPSS